MTDSPTPAPEALAQSQPDAVLIALKLMRSAFNAGFNQGCREHTTSRGGKTWPDIQASAENEAHVAFSGHTLIPTADLAALRAEANEGALYRAAGKRIRSLLTAAGGPVAAFIDDHVRDALVERNRATAEAERLREDAERWRALLGSARLRPLGWAGFDADSPGHAEGYRHFGMEFWTQHEASGANARSVQLLTDYADTARAALAKAPADE